MLDIVSLKDGVLDILNRSSANMIIQSQVSILHGSFFNRDSPVALLP